MSETKALVKALLKSMGLQVPEKRIDALARGYEATLEEAESVRGKTTPMPAPAAFDPSWSKKQ